MSGTRVYIGDLGNDCDKNSLEREFDRFGKLSDVWVARNPPGFAFIVFEDLRDAEDASTSSPPFFSVSRPRPVGVFLT